MTTSLTTILDRIEQRLPAVPRSAFKLNRTVTAAGFNTLAASANAICAASKTVSRRASTGAKTVGGQAESVAQRIETTVKSGVKEVAGQARAQTIATLDVVEAETVDLLESADTAIDDSPEGPYEMRTKDELYARAQELDINGRSSMSKSELVSALRASS